MSTNFLQPGDVMDFVAPAAGVTQGVPVISGGLFIVPAATAASGVTYRGKVNGVFTLAKTTSEGALAEGQPAFWDVANARTTVDSSLGIPIGTHAASALTGDTTSRVRLTGVSVAGRMLTIRKRFTIAQINAGATLLPAIPGASYRMVDSFAIAIGGAVTTVTTVDVNALLATVSRKLVSFTQASLTQSTMVRAGGAGGTILADGASFTKNDINTAVTVLKNGADITVATHVDFHLTYAIE